MTSADCGVHVELETTVLVDGYKGLPVEIVVEVAGILP
jgi:hypothetical protein